jgi:hypothetical protein
MKELFANISIVLVFVSLRIASNYGDTNSIRLFLVNWFIKELILCILITILFMNIFFRKKKKIRLIAIGSTIITIIVLLLIFRELTPY